MDKWITLKSSTSTDLKVPVTKISKSDETNNNTATNHIINNGI